ncbi:hypothetical protein MHYP_G00251100 [Metynnis hypsauchen]
MREASVLLLIPACATSKPGWNVFIIILAISLLVFTVMTMLIRGHENGMKDPGLISVGHLEEQILLVDSIPPSDQDSAEKETATGTLQTSGNTITFTIMK